MFGDFNEEVLERIGMYASAQPLPETIGGSRSTRKTDLIEKLDLIEKRDLIGKIDLIRKLLIKM